MTKGNEIAILDNFNLAPIEGSADITAAIAEEIGALGALDLARATIPAGGMLMFAVKAGADDDDPEMTKTLEGVIVHHHPAYAYWANPYAGAGTQPDCSSVDGVEGLVARTGEIATCASCPYNQFGSEVRADGEPGRGKACKNGHRVYLLRSGDYLPIIVSLPPTALRPLKQYIQSLIIPKPGDVVRRTYGVVTRIGLKSAKSGDGISYAVPTFEHVGDLPLGKVGDVLKYSEMFKQAAAKLDDLEATPFD